MGVLTNCSQCGGIFIKSGGRAVCQKCFQEEESQYQLVSAFLRKRQNRTATTYDLVQKTGVPERIIHQFIQQGRLLVSQFPNIDYPCLECGSPIHEGKLCTACAVELKKDLAQYEAEQQRQKERNAKEKNPTYRLNRD
ncbi:hypothetical protein FZC66_13425 [Priestia megaterium]|nr:hypothetical protein FZC66_13425 [Priestia megaterium]